MAYDHIIAVLQVSVCAFLVHYGGAPPATARPSGVRRGIPSPDTAKRCADKGVANEGRDP